MHLRLRVETAVLVGLLLWGSGYGLAAARYGRPKTVLHVVVLKWKPGTTAEQRRAVLEGVQQMAARIPGIRNIWLTPLRIGSLDYNAAFAIEFADRTAAERYASHPAHQAWAALEQAARATSLNVQLTN
jgi:hypothetical protein